MEVEKGKLVLGGKGHTPAVTHSQRKCRKIVSRKWNSGCRDIYFWLHGTDLTQTAFQFFIWHKRSPLFWSLKSINKDICTKLHCSALYWIYFSVFLCFIDAISINPRDSRWVGAWWLGLLICGAVNFFASLPFWFLPYSLTKEGENEDLKISHLSVQGDHCKMDPPTQPQLKFSEAVKGKRLLPKWECFLSSAWICTALNKMHLFAVQIMDKPAYFNL